jgi:mannose/cellobiose epimerase-like protein (N-acyl-D-glucosamine 2-epimerase family)
VHCDPPLDAIDCQAVLTAWWPAFETEFGLTSVVYVGAQHEKHGRRHEHRVYYSLVKADGRVVDTSQDYARRTYVNLLVSHALGLEP